MNFFNDCDLGLYGEFMQVSQHISVLEKIRKMVRLVVVRTTYHARVVHVKGLFFQLGEGE